jgi:hypothetical protein
MTFLNNYEKYFKTTVLKQDVLPNLLEKIDNFSISKDMNIGISYDYLIQNNKKYYLLIGGKQILKQQNSDKKVDILHFLPEQYNNDLLETNILPDFYFEIDSIFDDEFLLEGYLYKLDDKYEYLLTDIISKNNDIVNVSFELRYSLLNEIIQKIGKVCLKNDMTIKLHPAVSELTNIKTIENLLGTSGHTHIKRSNSDSDMTISSEYDSDMTISSLLESSIY